MPTIVKRTSPYRGVFVKRMRPNSSMHEQNKNLPYSRRHSFSHEYTGLMEQRRGVMKGKVESDFDENELKRLDQIISDENDKRHFTIKDYEEVRKKNREGRFIPSLTQMFQQKTNLPEVYRIHATKPNDVRLDIRVEDHQQQQPTNEVGYVSDSSISSDEDPVEREEIILTPVRSAPTPSGSPRTPTGPRKRPSLGTPEYDLAIPPVSPVTTPERPCPPVKSYDEVYDENYATLMAIVPVVPLHFRTQIQKWITKFNTMSDNDANKINRNQHLAFMLLQLQTLEMTTPFIKDPPPGELKSLGRNATSTFFKKWIKDAKKVSVQDKFKRSCKPLEIAQRMMNHYPDLFLENQPVPNFGMIAYGACFSSYDH